MKHIRIFFPLNKKVNYFFNGFLMFLCFPLFCSFIFDRIIFSFSYSITGSFVPQKAFYLLIFVVFSPFFYPELNYRLHGSTEFILVCFSLDREEAYHNVISFLSSSLTCLFFLKEKKNFCCYRDNMME